jgi:hypothetical protein
VLKSDPEIARQIGGGDLDRIIIDPKRNLGEAAKFVARVLASRAKP